MLSIFSIFLGFSLINTGFILWIRKPYQKNNFPRNLVSIIPGQSRWLYPDIGKTNTNKDIAIIGDSYAEGAGEEYTNNIYD